MSRLVCLVTLVAVTGLVAGLGAPSSSPPKETAQIQNKDTKGQERDKDKEAKDKEAKGQPQNEDLRKIETLLANSKKYPVRENGVLLDAKVEVKKTTAEDVLLLHWTIDYSGPRFPLHILKPGLGSAWYGQTYVLLFLVDEKGIAHPVPIHPKVSEALPLFVKEDFLAVKKGEVANGMIEVPLKRAGARKIQIREFTIPPARLYVVLRHNPTARGDQLELDAWTGNLQTALIPVPLENLDKKD